MKKLYFVIIALSSCLFLQNCNEDKEDSDTAPVVEAASAPDNTFLVDSGAFAITNIVAQALSGDYYVEGSFMFQQTTSVLLGNVNLTFDSTSTAPADGVYSLGAGNKQQSNILLSEMGGGNPQLFVAQSGKLNVDIVGGKKRYRVTGALFKQASGVGERKAAFTMIEN